MTDRMLGILVALAFVVINSVYAFFIIHGITSDDMMALGWGAAGAVFTNFVFPRFPFYITVYGTIKYNNILWDHPTYGVGKKA